MTESDSRSTSGLARVFGHPATWIVLIGGGILWSANGFPPIGFPTGEYVCNERSGSDARAVSVFHVGGGRINVVEYFPGGSERVESGITYSHGTFEDNLNLYLGESSFYCEKR